MSNDREDLWGKVLNGKYKRSNEATGLGEAKPYSSSLWTNIIKLRLLIAKLKTWAVGNGETIDALNDYWVETRMLLKNWLTSNLDIQHHLTVVELINDKGEWDWCSLRHMFPQDMLDKVATIHPPSKDMGRDISTRERTSNGAFTTTTTYEAFSYARRDNQGVQWKKIWRLKVLERIRVFI